MKSVREREQIKSGVIKKESGRMAAACVFVCVRVCVCLRVRVFGYKRLDNRQRAQEEGALPGGSVCVFMLFSST